jgi:hypothetical protein
MKSSTLFIYSFIHSHRLTCTEAAPTTHECGGKPSLFSSPKQMHFEMLVSKWFWAIVWHMNCSCKVYCWVLEVRSHNKKASHQELKHRIFTLTKGCKWWLFLTDMGPCWGLGSTALVHVWMIPLKVKLAVSNGFWPRTTKVFFFFSNGKNDPKNLLIWQKPSVNVWFVYLFVNIWPF